MNDKETTNDSSIDGAASALSAGLGVSPCKHCGSERYVIKMLYKGYRNNVAVVECGECGGDTTPVVLDYFMPEAECYNKCRKAWNAANVTPNVSSTSPVPHNNKP